MKACPNCESEHLIKFESFGTFMCGNCNLKIGANEMGEDSRPLRRRGWDRKDRKAQILEVGRVLAVEMGLAQLKPEHVADRASISRTLVISHFGGADDLRDAIGEAAIEAGDAAVVLEGLSLRRQWAIDAPPELRKEAARIALDKWS